MGLSKKGRWNDALLSTLVKNHHPETISTPRAKTAALDFLDCGPRDQLQRPRKTGYKQLLASCAVKASAERGKRL